MKRISNPYYISDTTRVELRDSRGKYSSVSKSKFYYIYFFDKLVYQGQFSRINLSSSKKWDLIKDDIENVKYTSTGLSFDYFDSSGRSSSISRAQYFVITRDGNIVAADTFPKVSDRASLKHDYVSAYYKFFLKVEGLEPEEVEEIEEEIEYKPELLPGDLFEEYKIIFSASNDNFATIQKLIYKFREPIQISLTNSADELENFLYNDLYMVIRFLLAMRVDGLDLIIPRLLYTSIINGEIHEELGIGSSRTEVRGLSDKEIADIIIEDLYESIMFVEPDAKNTRLRSYLMSSDDKSIYIEGFVLETLYEFLG